MLLDVINENGNAFVINDIAIDATPFINQMAEIGFSLNAEGLSEGNWLISLEQQINSPGEKWKTFAMQSI